MSSEPSSSSSIPRSPSPDLISQLEQHVEDAQSLFYDIKEFLVDKAFLAGLLRLNEPTLIAWMQLFPRLNNPGMYLHQHQKQSDFFRVLAVLLYEIYDNYPNIFRCNWRQREGVMKPEYPIIPSLADITKGSSPSFLHRVAMEKDINRLKDAMQKARGALLTLSGSPLAQQSPLKNDSLTGSRSLSELPYTPTDGFSSSEVSSLSISASDLQLAQLDEVLKKVDVLHEQYQSKFQQLRAWLKNAEKTGNVFLPEGFDEDFFRNAQHTKEEIQQKYAAFFDQNNSCVRTPDAQLRASIEEDMHRLNQVVVHFNDFFERVDAFITEKNQNFFTLINDPCWNVLGTSFTFQSHAPSTLVELRRFTSAEDFPHMQAVVQEAGTAWMRKKPLEDLYRSISEASSVADAHDLYCYYRDYVPEARPSMSFLGFSFSS